MCLYLALWGLPLAPGRHLVFRSCWPHSAHLQACSQLHDNRKSYCAHLLLKEYRTDFLTFKMGI